MGHLWTLPEFRQAAGLDTGERRYVELRQAIVMALNRPENQKLRDALGARLKARDLQGATLVGQLLELTSVRLLQLGNALYDNLLSMKLESEANRAVSLATVLDDEIVSALLLWLSLDAVVGQLKQLERERGMSYLNLPCGSMALAEVHLARLDGRRAELSRELEEGKFVVGALRTPYYDPAVGFAVNPNDCLRMFLKDIGEAHGVHANLMTQTELEIVARPINEAIEATAEPGDEVTPPRRPYLVFYKSEDADFAKRLAKLLPAIRVCPIDPNNYVDGEGALCALLMRFVTLRSRRGALNKHRGSAIL